MVIENNSMIHYISKTRSWLFRKMNNIHKNLEIDQEKRSLPWWHKGIECVCNAGNLDSISGLGKSPGEGHGYPLQYSCLENPMDRGA